MKYYFNDTEYNITDAYKTALIEDVKGAGSEIIKRKAAAAFSRTIKEHFERSKRYLMYG